MIRKLISLNLEDSKKNGDVLTKYYNFNTDIF